MQARIALEEQGVRIVDETGSIHLTQDILRNLHFMLRRGYGFSNSNILEAIDSVLEEQTKSLDNSRYDKELKEFLDGFNIRDRVGGELK